MLENKVNIKLIQRLTSRVSNAFSMALMSSLVSCVSLTGSCGGSLDFPLNTATAAITRDPRLFVIKPGFEQSSLIIWCSKLDLRLKDFVSLEDLRLLPPLFGHRRLLSKLGFPNPTGVPAKGFVDGPEGMKADLGRGFGSILLDNVGCSCSWKFLCFEGE